MTSFRIPFFSICLAVTVLIFSCDEDENTKPEFVPGEDLIAYYNFQNNTQDLVGNQDGTASNVTYSQRLDSDADLAASLSGNGNIVFPDFFDYPARTVSLWFKATAVGDTYEIIYSSDGPSVEHGMTILSVIKSANVVYLTYNVADNLRQSVIMEDHWYHAAFVVDGLSFKMFLDGEPVYSETFTTYVNSANSTYPGAVVGSSRAGDRFFEGNIDDLFIYNRALTPRQIELLYQMRTYSGSL